MQNVSENNIALGEVLVPQRLFNSVREGNLVIFAGSGVTKYGQKEAPLNEELAEQLGSPLGEKRHRDESIDAFLDRLKSYIPTIHEQYSKLLNNGILKPTDLHKVIIRLFKKSNLKIITTNQETLFTEVAEKVFGKDIKSWEYPVFPTPEEFNGIVYIHGANNSAIITETEFGKAYSTGIKPAGTFLEEICKNYILLYIGYSHDDPFMRYFSKGIADEPQVERYALVRADKQRSWEGLGIRVLPFPKTFGRNHFSALFDCLRDWVQKTIGSSTQVNDNNGGQS